MSYDIPYTIEYIMFLFFVLFIIVILISLTNMKDTTLSKEEYEVRKNTT